MPYMLYTYLPQIILPLAIAVVTLKNIIHSFLPANTCIALNIAELCDCHLTRFLGIFRIANKYSHKIGPRWQVWIIWIIMPHDSIDYRNFVLCLALV